MTNIGVLARAMQLIRSDYVDEKKTGYDELTHAALKGMLASLDPHSQFMEPRDFKGMQDDTNSRFGGLGVVVAVRDGMLTIITPMEDTPGARAGLLPGDQIIKIDGQSTEKFEINEAMEHLRGEPGQKVMLTVVRPATREVKDYELVRESIKVASVKDARLLPPELAGPFKIGYARITQFNMPTAGELGEEARRAGETGDAGFHPRSALQSRRAAELGRRCRRAISAAEDHGGLHAGAHRLADALLSDLRERQAAAELPRGGADQCRQRERLGDRGRRAQGPESRDPGGRDHLRQRLGAKRDPAPGRLGRAAHHGEVLHAEQAGHPRARRRRRRCGWSLPPSRSGCSSCNGARKCSAKTKRRSSPAFAIRSSSAPPMPCAA